LVCYIEWEIHINIGMNSDIKYQISLVWPKPGTSLISIAAGRDLNWYTSPWTVQKLSNWQVTWKVTLNWSVLLQNSNYWELIWSLMKRDFEYFPLCPISFLASDRIWWAPHWYALLTLQDWSWATNYFCLTLGGFGDER
jgi:hypothetical protein